MTVTPNSKGRVDDILDLKEENAQVYFPTGYGWWIHSLRASDNMDSKLIVLLLSAVLPDSNLITVDRISSNWWSFWLEKILQISMLDFLQLSVALGHLTGDLAENRISQQFKMLAFRSGTSWEISMWPFHLGCFRLFEWQTTCFSLCLTGLNNFHIRKRMTDVLEKLYVNRNLQRIFLYVRYLHLTILFLSLSQSLFPFLIILGSTESLEFPSSLVPLSPAPYLGSVWNQSCVSPCSELVSPVHLLTCKLVFCWTTRTLPSSL